LAAAAEYELEKRIERMNVFEVEVEKGISKKSSFIFILIYFF
jgi:hypothetical protein